MIINIISNFFFTKIIYFFNHLIDILSGSRLFIRFKYVKRLHVSVIDLFVLFCNLKKIDFLFGAPYYNFIIYICNIRNIGNFRIKISQHSNKHIKYYCHSSISNMCIVIDCRTTCIEPYIIIINRNKIFFFVR